MKRFVINARKKPRMGTHRKLRIKEIQNQKTLNARNAMRPKRKRTKQKRVKICLSVLLIKVLLILLIKILLSAVGIRVDRLIRLRWNNSFLLKLI